jgi:hypothetical protein
MQDQHAYDRSPNKPSAAQPPTHLPDEPYYQQPAVARPDSAPRRRARLWPLMLVLVGVLWLAFELMGRGWLFGSSGSATVLDRTAAGAARIELDAASADVDVRTWDGAGIRVEAVQRGGRSNDYRIGFDQSGDSLRVTTLSSPGLCVVFCNSELRYTVLVPASGRVTVRTSSGDVDLTGAGGADASQAPQIVTGSGDVKAESLSNGLSVETGSGSVKLDKVAGALKLHSNSGSVVLRDGAATAADVETGSGSIELHGVAGALNLRSSSGTIGVYEAGEALLNMSSRSGSVIYEGALAQGAHTVSTGSGSIKLRLPRDSSFSLQATAGSGDVSLDSFENQHIESSGRAFKAKVGTGVSQVTLETSSGDVRVLGRP